MLAAALMAPDAGVIRFEGRDLGTLSARDAADYQRRHVGFVYQSFHLMAGVPAVENAAIKLLADHVPLRQARRAATTWLERVGLAGRLNHTPDQLSGGERQRVAIARALVNEPRLILADEPTGSLDTQRGGEILALLAEIARQQQAAVLLVTHDSQAAAVADRVCTLRDGKLVDRSSRRSRRRRRRDGALGAEGACASPGCSTSTAGGCAPARSKSCSPASG